MQVMSTVDARRLAARAHGDPQDRDGSLRIDHVSRVARGVPAIDPYQRVAWLHHVVEDSDVSIGELAPHLPEAEVSALKLLAHDAIESYEDTSIGSSSPREGRAILRELKEADMLDNLRRCMVGRDPALAQYGAALSRLWSREPTPSETS